MIVTTRNRYPVYTGSFFAGNPFARVASLPAPARSTSGPAVKGGWVDEGYELTVDLPGVPESAVGVTVAGRMLSIDVSTDALSWSRQLRLPQSLDPEQVTARYLDGRLTLTVAKTAAPESRTIAIDTTSVQPAIDAPAQDDSGRDDGTETSVTE